MTYFAVVSHR